MSDCYELVSVSKITLGVSGVREFLRHQDKTLNIVKGYTKLLETLFKNLIFSTFKSNASNLSHNNSCFEAIDPFILRLSTFFYLNLT